MNDRLGSLLVAVIGNVVGGMFLGSAAGILFCHWKLPPPIDEAEAHAEAPTMSEQEPPTAWRKGYLMGLCIGAALLPKHVWASPERHERQQRT